MDFRLLDIVISEKKAALLFFNERDIILKQGKKIRVIPAWEFARKAAKNRLEPALI